MRRSHLLKFVKRVGTTSTFKCPTNSGLYGPAIVFFADAARPSENGQLGFLGCLLIDPLEAGSTMHTLSWTLELSQRPAQSIASAEVLAARDAIDTGKLIANIYKALLGIEVHLYVIVDS